MDLAYWGLRENPFRIALTNSTLALLPGQAITLQNIINSFLDGERVALLTGQHGVGKTLVAHQLTAHFENRGMQTAWAACAPVMDSQALYQMLLADCGLPFAIRSTVELRMNLMEHLLPFISEDKSTLLIVDEAQHVPVAILEELRPLIETTTPAGHPGVQLLLVGTDLLQEKVREASELGLFHWIGCRSTLKPLEVEEAVKFLQEQWRRSGGKPAIQFSDEAWTMLAEMGQGVLLHMNRLARHALRLAESGKQKLVDAEAIWEAASFIGMTTSHLEQEDTILVPLPTRGNLKDSA